MGLASPRIADYCRPYREWGGFCSLAEVAGCIEAPEKCPRSVEAARALWEAAVEWQAHLARHLANP